MKRVKLEELLKNKRKSILMAMNKVNSVYDIYKIQEKIVKEIIHSEKLIKQDETGEHKWNIHMLRCYGDAVAWNLLHPHIIRQLNKNPSPPQSLSNQGDAFDLTLETAKEYSNKGYPVIISDITNCINIGDIIVCTNPEKINIVECKKGKHSPEKMMQGRRGRQISKALGTMEYLTKGRAKVFGESGERIVYEADKIVDYNWKGVNKAVKKALKTGEGISINSDYDIVWAYREEGKEPSIPKKIEDIISNFKKGVDGCHLRAIEENYLIPPPAAWPIDLECQIALMEGEIVLFHLIDTDHFTKIKTPYGKIKKILFSKKYAKEFCFVVETKGHFKTLSSRFLEEVVYGYATMESMAENMIEFAFKTSKFSAYTEQKKGGKKPPFIFIKNLKEALKLYDKGNNINKETIVFVSEGLFEKMEKIKNKLSERIKKLEKLENK